MLHVIELIAGLSHEEGKDFYDRLERKARKHVADLAAARAPPGSVPDGGGVRQPRRRGSVVPQQSGTDLIVLTSHRVDPQQGAAGLGTLSHKVGILSPCPVLLVK